MRDPISLATNFPRFEASGNDLCWHGDPQTRWFDMQFLVDAPIKNTMATTLEADYVFGTKDFELGAKVVKFAVIQGHQGEGAQEHELASFEAMMLPHMDAAHNLARWLLRNEQDAQDIVQEAYLRAFKSFGGFHGSNGRAWLLTIVRNTAYTLLKKNRAVDLTTTFDEEIHAVGQESTSPATILEHAEDAELIKNAMEELPVEFREILTLRHQESLSYAEIGEILKIPIGTVMSRLARARGKLKEYLAARMSQEK
ncbi:MAG TPA: sigma-70 family RNA polymerase sigma factor [Candidatus Acidoferrum sp.]|jgi:RNA polymerase sigma-70 factor (ECF subfamily)|nr:sigma-70 family RNA polymerase sigma factor [Candidatus Acidoferrum sp.]